MTPSLFNCTQKCLFCWRAQSGDLKSKWDELSLPKEWDQPETIVSESIRAQLAILSGYKANPKTDQQKLKEAIVPRQVAISLAGEPTIYKQLDELICQYHSKSFTTFLVSNGTLPEALTKLKNEPSQLYISLCAPSRKDFERVCRPQVPNAWKKLNETLDLLRSFKCPTAVRLTLARNLNMKNVKSYAKMIEKADPTYVEPKAYMHVGFSRLRLGFENTPSHEEIHDFSMQLAKETGYNYIDEAEESRVVLLSKLRKPISFDYQ